jgi:hypothetical protein
MRAVRAFCCATAIAVLVVPAIRADEYNKLTYLTFSGSVQVPGATLPAGTYMFKLADPESGRRVIQIWDQEGTKLYTTLLSIPDQLMEAKDEPVVLFSERPAGEPQAIKAWFYPADRYGYEFVYPKDQAMKIAQATHASVLATNESVSNEADVATRAGAKVGRINEQGQFEEGQSARREPTPADQSTTTQSVTSSTPEPATSAATTPDDPDDRAQSSTAAAPAAPAPGSTTQPSANRTDAAAAPSPRPATMPDNAATSTSARSQDSSTARTPTAATGTSGQTPQPAGTSGQLPNTASSWPLVQLFAGLSLLGSIAIHRMRRRATVRA